MSELQKQRPVINLKPKVKATQRYKKYLQLLSLFLPAPLTAMEIDILDEFYQVSNGVINTESRRHVREALNKSSEQINNYILKLRKNRIIIEDEVNKTLIVPIPKGDTFSIHIDMQVVV